MKDTVSQLKGLFLEEAEELLAEAEYAFLELERSVNDPNILETIFRLAHNLKGSARAVGLKDVNEFTHKLESIILKIQNKELELSRSTIDLLLQSGDYLRVMIRAIKQDQTYETSQDLLKRLQFALDGKVESAPESNKSESSSEQTVASSVQPSQTSPLDRKGSSTDSPQPKKKLLIFGPNPNTIPTPNALEAKDLSPDSIENEQISQSMAKSNSGSEQDETIRVSLNRLERLVNSIGELVILKTVLAQQKHQIASPFLQKTITQLEKITRDIQDVSMGLRMMPLRQTFRKMQRVVRDTADTLGKEIRFDVIGEEIELDKTVVDRLSDPLIHLIRNGIDHGVELPSDRENAGKNREASLSLKAGHRGGKVVIEVRDDGRGIDVERILAKACEKGLIKSSDSLSKTEAVELIFHPGFSTKSEVTEISGRGVGLDVVKYEIENNLKGKIELESEFGVGTCFRIVLPLTLAIIDGLVTRTGNECYVVPLNHVHESIRLKGKDCYPVKGFGEVLHFRGENIPVYHLSNLIGSPGKKQESSQEEAGILVRNAGQPFCVIVDEIVGRQQVVIRKLGEEIGHLKGISGGAILGDGSAALILDLAELISRRGLKSQQLGSLGGAA